MGIVEDRLGNWRAGNQPYDCKGCVLVFPADIKIRMPQTWSAVAGQEDVRFVVRSGQEPRSNRFQYVPRKKFCGHAKIAMAFLLVLLFYMLINPLQLFND